MKSFGRGVGVVWVDSRLEDDGRADDGRAISQSSLPSFEELHFRFQCKQKLTNISLSKIMKMFTFKRCIASLT